MKKLSIKKLPLITILVAVFLAIGLVLFIGAYSKKGALSKLSIWGAKEAIIESENKDTDNDGLKDWQEELFKTDPYNSDTDGDGYLDGEEVNSGHNPLIKSPGDKLTFYPLPLGDRYNVTKKILSEKVIDSMIDSYVSQKGEYILDHPEIDSQETFSASIKESTLQEMSLRALADAYPDLLEKAEQTISEIPEIFDISITDNDINIHENNNQEAINLYLSQVSNILNSNSFFLQEQSLQAVLSAFEQGDFSKLDSLIKSNDAKIERAKEISVPSSWKEVHKEGMELTLLIRNIFVSLRDIQDDPLKAYIALEELEYFPETWNVLMKKAINLAESQGIELSLQ